MKVYRVRVKVGFSCGRKVNKHGNYCTILLRAVELVLRDYRCAYGGVGKSI